LTHKLFYVVTLYIPSVLADGTGHVTWRHNCNILPPYVSKMYFWMVRLFFLQETDFSTFLL